MPLKLWVIGFGVAAVMLYGLVLLTSPVFLPSDSVVCNAHIMHPGDNCHHSGGRTGKAHDLSFDEQKSRNVWTGSVCLGFGLTVIGASWVLYAVVKHLGDGQGAAPGGVAVPPGYPPHRAFGQPRYIPPRADYGRPQVYDVPPTHRPPTGRHW